MGNSRNSSLKDEVLKCNSIDINTYEYGKGKTANFLEHAAEKYNLSYIKKDKTVILNYKDKEIARMSGLRPSSTDDIAYKLCKDKFKLEQFLNKMNLNTLSSVHFTTDEYSKALEFISSNSKEIFVIKPLNLAGGKGIQFGVNINNFEQLWKESIRVQLSEGIKNPSCIIQPFVNGFDVRVSIIEGRYCGAILRLPAHVVGNGTDTISQLIDYKNDLRKTISYFRNKLIVKDKKLDIYLERKSISYEYIPLENEVVMLSEISNLTHGGESIDITDSLSFKIRNLAINAAASVPGLYTTGIDIMTEDYINGNGHIIEMNTSANLTMHHLPLKGKKRFPNHFFVRTNLIRHKVESGVMLTKKEIEIWSEVNNFMKLKDKFACKLVDLSEL